MKNFVLENWALIALVLNECLAFLPKKWNSIGQIILKIASAISEQSRQNALPTKTTKKTGKIIPVAKITKIESNQYEQTYTKTSTMTKTIS